tara:strand:- start:232 stop:336 length:105 start_codon:yes stop_codon:yes gene_type:complete
MIFKAMALFDFGVCLDQAFKFTSQRQRLKKAGIL